MQASPTKQSFMFQAGRRFWLAAGVFCLSLSCVPALGSPAEHLVIDYIVSHSAQRTAWIRVINEFSAANPDVRVTHHGYPQEQYKRDFTSRLRSGQVDLAFWYAGERLRDAVESKLLAPVDADTVALLKRKKFYPATIEATRIGNEVYGFPMYYYPWGFIYRKSLFNRLELSPPATWSEFLRACEKLSAAGITPIGLGAAAN